MLDAVIDSIVQILSAGGINAVKKYPVDVLDCSKKTVCVSLRSAKITASGCGNYIGLTAENGSIKEMLGSRGQLRIGLDIYSPSPNCDLLKEQICAYMGSVSSLTVTDFEAGEGSYDGETEMYRCECTVGAKACLVRQLSDPEGNFDLEED